MKIVIDASALLVRSAGVKNYLHYWLLSLLKTAPEYGDAVTTYPSGIPIHDLPDHESSVLGIVGTFLRLGLVHLVNVSPIPLLDPFLRGSQIFHCSQLTTKLPRHKPASATVFDFSWRITPQYHTAGNLAVNRRYAESVLKRCDALIAISAHARDDAMEILKISSDRIRVIYPGVAECFFHITTHQLEVCRAKYKLDMPYLLFIGCIEPRKNVPGLIRAYRCLPRQVTRDLKLILVGPFGWETEATRKLLMESGPDVRYLGYVHEADLPGLISNATALVYPSFFEGFGLPVAQAMAAGTPVIGSDRASLPEVIGDAGMCVNPDSCDELAAAMHKVATSPELVKTLAQRGRSRAERFRWAKAAAESIRFFHDVAGR